MQSSWYSDCASLTIVKLDTVKLDRCLCVTSPNIALSVTYCLIVPRIALKLLHTTKLQNSTSLDVLRSVELNSCVSHRGEFVMAGLKSLGVSTLLFVFQYRWTIDDPNRSSVVPTHFLSNPQKLEFLNLFKFPKDSSLLPYGGYIYHNIRHRGRSSYWLRKRKIVIKTTVWMVPER